MADELDPTEGLPGDEVVPEDDTQMTEATTTTEDDTPADNPIEALASEMGWAPKEQFRGNPEDWKPADEFIRAGKDIQRNLSRDLKELKGTVANMSRTSATLLEQQLAERDAYWQQQRREAIEAGDVDAVERADEQRQQIRQQLAPSRVEDPAVEDFTKKHSAWFNKDPEATAWAVNRADHYAKQGLSAARQLAAVEHDMKGVFPDLFPAPAKQPPRVATPPSRTAAAPTRKKGFHDLPAEAQAVARDMHERLNIPLETYVTNYFNERKVG